MFLATPSMHGIAAITGNMHRSLRYFVLLECITSIIIVVILQINYEYLRGCVASAPVPLMPPSAWDCIMDRIGARVMASPLNEPMLTSLHDEVKGHYEDTIRRSNISMTLVRPSLRTLSPEPPLPTDPK